MTDFRLKCEKSFYLRSFKVTATNSLSLRGKCYRMKGRKAIRNARPKAVFDTEGYKLLGKGMCRGDGWQTEPWPLVRGRKTQEECFESCKNRKGCTAFEIGPPRKKDRYQCLLFGHDDVQVSDSFSLRKRKCFRLPGQIGRAHV